MKNMVSYLILLLSLVATGCTSNVGTETPVDQDSPVDVITSTSVPKVSTTETEPTVISSMVTTAVVAKVLSPAWIEAKEINRRLSTDAEESHVEFLADSRFYNKYIRENTNSLSSSQMGALCWAVQELSRTHELYLNKVYDEEMAEGIIGLLGIVDENYDNQESLDFLLDYLTGDITVDDDGNNGPVGVVDEDNSFKSDMSDLGNSIEDDEWTKEDILTIYRDPAIIDVLRVNQEGSGDGTEWPSAVRSVMRPEVRDAVRVGKGLSTDVQLYADALFKAVQDYIDSGQTEPSIFYEDLSGFHDFVEAAKYSPDCKRLSIALDELRDLLQIMIEPSSVTHVQVILQRIGG